MNRVQQGGKSDWTAKTPSEGLNRVGIKMGGVKATTIPPNPQVVKTTRNVSNQKMPSNPPPVPSRDTAGYKKLREGVQNRNLKLNPPTVKTGKIGYTAFEKFIGIFSKEKKVELQQKRTITEREIDNLKNFDINKNSEKVQKSSLNLGKAILKLTEKNDKASMKHASQRLEKGKTYPGKCMNDLWRLADKFSIYQEGSDEPLVSPFNPEKATKDQQLTEQTAKILNILYKHGNEEKGDLVSGSDVNGLRIKQGKDDPSFGQVCEKSGVTGDRLAKMQKLLGLGAQELWTRAMEESVIPKDYKNGKEGIKVAEFRAGGGYGPFESNRTVSVTLKKDGGLEVRVSQPVTFRKSDDDQIIGTCRCVTTYGFDKNMNCVAMQQELGVAEIKKENK